MNTSNDLTIAISSYPEYEEVVADIECDDELVARVHEEKGIGNYTVELHPRSSSEKWVFTAEDFLRSINEAIGRLQKMGPKATSS